MFKQKIKLNLKLDYKSIDPYKPLPPNLLINSAGSHLYQHGIVLFQHGEKHRKFYYNPALIFFVEFVYFTRSLVSLFVDESNRSYFVYSGDYMYFIRAKTHINIAATQYMLVGINILIINYVKYRNNIYPEFIHIFDFLNGKKSPASVGIRNSKYILSLTIKAHLIFNFVRTNTTLVFFVSFLLSLLPTMLNFTLTENILFGIPWSFVFAISSYHTFSSYFWNIAYFYVLCHLLKFRLREINDDVVKVANLSQYFKRFNLLRLHNKYQTIGREVKIYNDTYWSLFLFVVIIFLSTFLNVVLYASLFVPMNIVMQVSLLYAVFITLCAIFFILKTASVIYHEAHKSRLVLNSLYCSVHNHLSYRQLLKLSHIIENMTDRNIGFYFLNLFVINYSRFFEIVGMIAAYFLKVIDMSRN